VLAVLTPEWAEAKMVAAMAGVPYTTAYHWLMVFKREGLAEDRQSRSRVLPTKEWRLKP
jgi:sugar-specific transcriptional regulator TrmB